MPITPLHFGPALAVREAVGHHRFGIWSFTATQVLFDLEPAMRMFFDLDGTLHQTTHNPTFELIYALIAAACLWRWEKWGAVVGALFGSTTHLLLDALYHSDVAEALASLGNFNAARQAGWDAEAICYTSFALWLVFTSIRKLRNKANLQIGD